MGSGSHRSMSPISKTVLVVDDDEGMRDTLTAILKRRYRVLTAATGEAGLEVIRREHVDLMLLDVRLPGISGAGSGAQEWTRPRLQPIHRSLRGCRLTATSCRPRRCHCPSLGAMVERARG
jgi:CheY-like chemotaxis protein